MSKNFKVNLSSEGILTVKIDMNNQELNLSSKGKTVIVANSNGFLPFEYNGIEYAITFNVVTKDEYLLSQAKNKHNNNLIKVEQQPTIQQPTVQQPTIQQPTIQQPIDINQLMLQFQQQMQQQMQQMQQQFQQQLLELQAKTSKSKKSKKAE